jgi:hypothetical protein
MPTISNIKCMGNFLPEWYMRYREILFGAVRFINDREDLNKLEMNTPIAQCDTSVGGSGFESRVKHLAPPELLLLLAISSLLLFFC